MSVLKIMTPGGGIQSQSARIRWIDCARGIAMLLVVLGHCYMRLEDPVNRFILSFHMPVFFFLSGMCAKASGESFKQWAIKKARGLLIPQLTLAAIVFIYTGLSCGFSTSAIVDSLLVWFLPTLYLCDLAFYWIAKFAGKSIKYWVLVLFASGAAAPSFDLLNIEVCPVRPETVLAGLFFFCLGHVWRLIGCKVTVVKPVACTVAICLVPVIYFLSQLNVPIAMYEGSYGIWPLFYFTATIGIAWVCLLGQLLDGVPFFIWFGQVSVIAYVAHFRLVPLLRAITSRMLYVVGVVPGSNESALLLFVLTTIVLIPLVRFCDIHLAFLFGKRRIRGEVDFQHQPNTLAQ